MRRRQLLGLGAASAALISLPSASWGRGSVSAGSASGKHHSTDRWSTDPFTLGVASGSPTSDSMVLWTRLGSEALAQTGRAHAHVPVAWQLAHDEQFTRIAQQGQLTATPELGHSLHAEVSGLSPAREYFYRFIAGDVTSPTGRTRTFPAPDQAASRLRLAYASCQRWGDGFYSAYRDMRGQNLDVVIFLGDYIYEYPASPSRDVRVTTGGWVLTLDDYRARYALHKSDPHLQAMHAACPWIVTWDDHEVQNDYAELHAGFSGAPVPDFAARRRSAYQAFYENMPVRHADFAQLLKQQGDQVTVFGSTQFGRLATLYNLDNRQYRHRQACTPGDRAGGGRINPDQCALLNQEYRTLLGEQQEGWLKRQFERSQTHWNLIGQQSLLGPRNMGGATPSVWNDGWGGYPAARQRLIDSIRTTRLKNPVVLGGDVHQNWVGRILSDYARPDSQTVGVEFCGTSITSRNRATEAELAKILQNSPYFLYANAEYRGYGVVDVQQHTLTTTLRAVKNIRDPNSEVFTLRKFGVDTGRPEVQTL
ncbi:alkaline phosphatase D family protein [Zwartia panacis]|uniref:alkaline phosphatase D family protein n=1 Tax=Zwartia panacis TaxID=2683345 RepID=UPI0025B454C6|nr:alkaline phosphatase D family protein [Zwartia panacis]MDN4017811.1 alkaline phosphatase D family protein [Zwartia panacis]